MNPIVSQISIDLLAILRVSLAFFFGITYAMWLQHSRQGQFLANERTWITVVIGIGVDLALAYDGDWWTVVLVIAASSVGIMILTSSSM